MGASRPENIFDLLQVAQAGLKAVRPDDGALLLMHFAFRGLVAQADVFLARHGLSRVHHRMLYAIARADGMPVGQLVALLGVSKQALHRPLKHLQEEGLVLAERSPHEHRTKLLRLTREGARIERAASAHEAAVMDRALRSVGERERDAWRRVMLELARNA
ncbi:DNA-binding MarR family transcriptional regulator [Variovorax sp. TBS-050B]|uniref:MarR family winged helix-turn-helix transcriptional regulator n=1 Tax=Variovorax sp. TBS-050B TaxID=2940551 RepID=UPI00247599B6|nr:MarR family transcriptional regulator [Variovorax sp. TBS-050B]MDH6590384.1 DNA-binding MarR family transcriptional regulator [Variovorax sp. TBS-050B]